MTVCLDWSGQCHFVQQTIYGEFTRKSADRKPGEEYEMVLAFAEATETDDIFELIEENKYNELRAGASDIVESVENDYLRDNSAGKDDLFYSLSNSTLRLFDSKNDPAPIYPIPGKIESQKEQILKAADVEDVGSKEFAYEEDLKKYLAKNLAILEPGLKLYEDEDIKGIEYDAGGRYIDILAIDTKENYVVIELKVSRGYDRCVGQILRYINWIRENLAEPEQKVRGMIVCREITDDLQLACKSINEIELFEYELKINVKKIK